MVVVVVVTACGMSESIQVAVRIRPFHPHEAPPGCVSVQGRNHVLMGEKNRCFAFDTVLGMDSSSEDVYQTVGASLAKAFLDGFNVAVIAYGQTGAGKTFTMEHLSKDLFDDVFHTLHESGESSMAMRLTVVEVYNETLRDLLASHSQEAGTPDRGGSSSASAGGASCSTGGGNSIQLRELPKGGGMHIHGLREVEVRSRSELQRYIDSSTSNRKTASTLMNATSSRSHCVVTVAMTRRGVVSKCCLVDLAGSERLKKSLGFNMGGGGGTSSYDVSPFSSKQNGKSEEAVVMERAREGININGGLLALGNVIVALCERRPHIPFRSSKLTRLLQPVLTGNCRTAMVACVSPESSSFEETLNTLKYADRAKSIKTDPRLVVATSGEDTEAIILGLRKEIEELQQQLQQFQSSPLSLPPGRPPLFPKKFPAELQHSKALLNVQALLKMEKRETKRLEDELFHAEYTAMVETEKRKVLEARLSEVEAVLFAVQQQFSDMEKGTVRLEEELRLSRSSSRQPSLSLSNTPIPANEEEVDNKGNGKGPIAIQKLVKEKHDLQHAKVRLEAEVQRLECTLRELQEKEATSPSSPSAGEGKTVVDVVNEAFSGVSHEIEQQREAARRRGGGEALLDVATIQSKYNAALQLVVSQLGGLKGTKAARQSVSPAPARPASRGAGRSEEEMQAQAQLKCQLKERMSELEKLAECMRHKEGEIEVAKKRSSVFATNKARESNRSNSSSPKLSAGSPSHLKKAIVARMLQPMGSPSSPLTTPTRSISNSTNSSRQASPAPMRGVPMLGSSLRGGEEESAAKVQEAIEGELRVLEDLESEIKELETYKQSLSAVAALFTNAPRWGQAIKGYHRRLGMVEEELADSTLPKGPQRASLEEERATLESHLAQVEAYQEVVDQANLQLEEVNRRVESLNDTVKFHLHRVLRLQHVGSGTSLEEILDTTRDSGRGGAALPSVREISTSRGRWQQGSHQHKSNSALGGEESSRSTVALLQATVTRQALEIEQLQAQLKKEKASRTRKGIK